jgi:Tfp pilus assembly protein PilV
MGQQQLLLILLGVILVGAAIVLALSLMGAQSVQANKDAIINDLNHLAAHAYQYRISSSSLAGGAGKYTGYRIPTALTSNENASYSCSVTPDEVTLTAISANNPANTITAKVDGHGLFIGSAWTYTGDFE